MQSNENWAASSIVLNHRSKTGTKKRGKHHYITYTQLKEKFGVHSRMIRDKKYAMEKERDPSDPSPAYWRKHPEVPDEKERCLAAACTHASFAGL